MSSNTNTQAIHNVVIIGSGPAGLTCGIYCGRSGLDPVLFSGSMPGGQLTTTDYIENYPGIASISGPDLMVNMISHAEKAGCRIEYDSISTIDIVDCEPRKMFALTTESGQSIVTRSVVIATGSGHKKLNIPGEKEFANKGVSWCATCDGPMYRGKTVAVLGGGNSAVIEAVFLSNLAGKVYLVHRRDTLRAEKTLQNKLFGDGKVECIWNAEVTEIKGSSRVESLSFVDNITKEKKEIMLDGVFIAIGLTPCSKLVADLVDLDETGYVKADKTITSVPGIFAIGDVVADSLKQAVYSAGQGSLCACMVEQYLGLR